jgi:hypothetical protein
MAIVLSTLHPLSSNEILTKRRERDADWTHFTSTIQPFIQGWYYCIWPIHFGHRVFEYGAYLLEGNGVI